MEQAFETWKFRKRMIAPLTGIKIKKKLKNDKPKCDLGSYRAHIKNTIVPGTLSKYPILLST